MSWQCGVRAVPRVLSAWCALALACVSALPSPARADSPVASPVALPSPPEAQADDDASRDPAFWVSAGVHSAFLSDLMDGSWQGLTFGAELKLGRRWLFGRHVGTFLQLDTSFWFTPVIAERDSERPFDSALQGALNIGVGVDVLYFSRRMRGAFSLGPSILLRDNAVDNAGAVGVFIDFRPAGVRVRVGRGVVLVIDPLTFTMLMPDLGGIPLVQIEYRTVLALEFGVRGAR